MIYYIYYLTKVLKETLSVFFVSTSLKIHLIGFISKYNVIIMDFVILIYMSIRKMIFHNLKIKLHFHSY